MGRHAPEFQLHQNTHTRATRQSNKSLAVLRDSGIVTIGISARAAAAMGQRTWLALLVVAVALWCGLSHRHSVSEGAHFGMYTPQRLLQGALSGLDSWLPGRVTSSACTCEVGDITRLGPCTGLCPFAFRHARVYACWDAATLRRGLFAARAAFMRDGSSSLAG